MKFLPTFAVYGTENHLTDERLEESATNYILHMKSYRKAQLNIK
ncbi:hypothetical protein [Bacillus sp. BP-3]|nr:hypothetical protein [Bacillus sp. BP-3]